MLGKLLKHELKAQYKLYLGMYAIVLLFSGMTSILGYLSDRFENSIFSTFYITTLMFSILGLVALFFVTLILSVFRYYNNLIKDEGYLMHTLPVPPLNLHLVKLIVPICWFLADAVVLFLSVTLMTGDFEWIKIVNMVLQQSGISINAGWWIQMGAYALTGILTSLSMFYACLNAGSLSASNKGVMAFVAYIVFYMANQMLSLISMVILFLVLIGPSGDWIAFLEAETPPDGYFTGIMITTTVLSLLTLVIYNVISGYIITKKVNLE